MKKNSSLDSTQPKTSKQSFWLKDIFLITLITAICYGCYLGSYPLQLPDEGRYSDVVREMLITGNYIIPLTNGIPFIDKPPLFFWMQTFFVQIFGLNEWGLRLWPVTVGILGCLSNYLTGYLLFNRQTGQLAAFILATSIFYFIMSHVADLDLTVSVLISCSLFAFLLGIKKENHRHYFFYGAYLFAALAILAKGLMGIVLPAMVVGLWIFILERWSLLLKIQLITGLLIILALCSPWFFFAQKQIPTFLHYFFYTQQFHRYLATEFNSHQNAWYYLVVISVGFLPWSFFGVLSIFSKIKDIYHRNPHFETYLFLLIWIISITFFFSIPVSKTISYILPVFPPLALLTASYLQPKLQHSKRFLFFIVAFISLSFLILITAAFLLAQKRNYFHFSTSKPLALKLKKLLRPEDTVIFFEGFSKDLPVYLNHDLLLATNFKYEKLHDNWRQDFNEGLKIEKYRKKMIVSPQRLSALWRIKNNNRIYLFTTANQIPALKITLQAPIYLVGFYRQLYLFTNKPFLTNIPRSIGSQ